MPDENDEREPTPGARRAAAEARIKHQGRWVEMQIDAAIRRGDFDDLPGLGKPIEGLGTEHDPDWWLKKVIEREQVTGVLPPALALRKEDAELDARLDRLHRDDDVRRVLEEFNARVRKALYQPLGGPPLITRQRDVEAEVDRWRSRREGR
jgi:hypothetical protein